MRIAPMLKTMLCHGVISEIEKVDNLMGVESVTR